MEQEQQQDKGAKSGMTRAEQIAALMPALRKFMPAIVEVARAYHGAYPADKTDGAVLDAVTVAVPLRHFMVMASVCTNLVVIEIEKEAEAKKAEAKVQQ